MTTTLTTPTRTIPATTTAPIHRGFRYAAVSLTGRLSVLEAPDGGARLMRMGRRNTTGTVYRVDLDDGITCWLDGDHQGVRSGAINSAATQICAALSLEPFADPFVSGPVILTGADGDQPAGLTDQQISIIAEAHACAEEWDF